MSTEQSQTAPPEVKTDEQAQKPPVTPPSAPAPKKKLYRFRLLRGSHTISNGPRKKTRLVAGDEIESDRRMDRLFINKFELLNDPEAAKEQETTASEE